MEITQVSTDMINKACKRTVECHSALQSNKVLTHAMTWLKPADITLSERSPTQKDKSCMVPFRRGPRAVTSIDRREEWLSG